MGEQKPPGIMTMMGSEDMAGETIGVAVGHDEVIKCEADDEGDGTNKLWGEGFSMRWLQALSSSYVSALTGPSS